MSLTLADISYAFGARQVLDNVAFEVREGRFCALLGPNGAGKSTLFNLLTRLFTTSQGRIVIAGHDMADSPRAALSRVGVVFQSQTLDLDLTVRQNLRYYAALHGLTGRAAALRIDAALDRLNIADRARDRARDLNGGHRRRTEIARALVHAPQVLLLDEPTVGLDAASRAAITDHVHALCADQGLTVLWATHLTDEVAPTDQVVILHQGRVLQDTTASAIGVGSALREHFLTLTAQPA